MLESHVADVRSIYKRGKMRKIDSLKSLNSSAADTQSNYNTHANYISRSEEQCRIR